MLCPNCNKELIENAKFCTSCGKSLIDGALIQKRPEIIEPQQYVLERYSKNSFRITTSSMKSKILNILKIVVLTILVVLIIYSAIGVWNGKKKLDKINNDINDLNNAFSYLELTGKRGYIDLTTSSLQDIGDGFFTSIESVNPHLTGVKVSGTMINSSSLDHFQAKFKITIGDQMQEFTIDEIPSSYSIKFKVYIPNVPKDKTSYGKIEYDESSIRYLKYREEDEY